MMIAVTIMSPLQEALLELFRSQPALVTELLSRLPLSLPAYDEVRIEETSLNELEPAECRADLVLSLRGERPALGIIVEAQLQQDTQKRYAWPLYVSGLRARLRCPVVLCVVTPKRSVARWAATPIRLGGGNQFQAIVFGPAAIPAITDRERAEQLPELAVLSAIAHAKSLDHERSAKIADAAIHACEQLSLERSVLYCDIVLSSLSETARKLLQTMDPAKYEFQSEIAKRWIAVGRAEGQALGRGEGREQGRADVLLHLLEQKFGPLDAATHERVRLAPSEEVQRWVDGVFASSSLQDLLNTR